MVRLYCDACGKEIDKDSNHPASVYVYDKSEYLYNESESIRQKDLDLCEDCYAKYWADLKKYSADWYETQLRNRHIGGR